MTFSREEAVKGLKEVTKMMEEGCEVDSSALGVVQDFLKNFPLSTKGRNMSTFPSELLQLIFSFLPLDDLKSVVRVCKRWLDVGEAFKLWGNKKVIIEGGEGISISGAVKVTRRRGIKSIQAIGLSSDQVEKVVLGMTGYLGLEELDLGGGDHGHLNRCSIQTLSPELFRSALPNLVKVNISNTEPTGEQLVYLFGKVTVLDMEQVDLTGLAPEAFAKLANLVELNISDTAVNGQQVQRLWTGVEQVADLQLRRLSVKRMNLSTVSPQALAKVAAKVKTLDISNTGLTPAQCNAIFAALPNNPGVEDINLSDNLLSSVPPEGVAKAVQKAERFLLVNTALTVHQAEAILTAVSSEASASYLHTLDLSNNLLSAVDPELLGDAVMKLESATLYDTSLTVAQVCRGYFFQVTKYSKSGC